MIANTEAQRIGEMRIEKLGGTGACRQVSPDPHRPHSPKLEIQGMC
jgi:hypothetical protein